MTESLIKPAIICDVDGTLALKCDRDIFDFALAGGDYINGKIRDIVNLCFKSMGVIIVTAREEKFHDVTKNWLISHGVQFDQLLMRKNGDFRKDCKVKKEIFEKHIKNNYDIQFVLDDRDQVVRMWRENGLTCLQVDDGDF